jgi:MFS family permease
MAVHCALGCVIHFVPKRVGAKIVSRDVRRNIRLLALFNFLLEFRPYGPIMVIYFERITHSYTLAMSVLAADMLSAAIFEVPTGIFSDRAGRRYTLIAGAAASLASVTCYALGGSYLMLIAGAACGGLARSLFSGNNDALLYDTLSELDQRSEYSTHLGRVSSAYQLALAISALLGGLLATLSFALVLWLSVIPKVLMVGLSFRFLEPKIHIEKSANIFAHLRQALSNIIKNRRLRLLSIGEVIGLSVGEADFLFRTVFIETLWPLWAIGMARTISNITAAMSFYFAAWLHKRFGEKRILFGGIALSNLTNIVSIVWASALSPALMGATSIFFGVNTIALNSMKQREFSDAQRSTMGSLTAFGGSLLFAAVSTLIGWLADQIGVHFALLVSTSLCMLPLAFYWLAFRHKQEIESQETQSPIQLGSNPS